MTYKSIKDELPFLRNLLVLLKTYFSQSFRARHGIYPGSSPGQVIDSRFRGN